MTRYVGRAPGKIILFGEHAVVYGQPALAVPVFQVEATAMIEDEPAGSGLSIHATDLNLMLPLAEGATHPLVEAARLTLTRLNRLEPNARITIHSTIPIASGLGSGTAVSAALARALAGYFGQDLPAPELSSLVHEVEKVYHGTPSGIDNTVVCFGQPVYFVRNQTIEPLVVKAPLHLVIGNTGIASPTHIAVRDVRAAWEQDRATYEPVFAGVGQIAQQARQAIRVGRVDHLGPLMTQNQSLLQQLDVSSPELESLIGAAINAGALGAKLSGGGRGGNMIALVDAPIQGQVATALQEAGAVDVICTTVPATQG
jgi:mevalonate kinase